MTCVLETGHVQNASSITSHHVACATSVIHPGKVDVLVEWMEVGLSCVPVTGNAISASSITSLHVTSVSSAPPQNDLQCSRSKRTTWTKMKNLLQQRQEYHSGYLNKELKE